MRFLIDILHPAHVHFFRPFIQEMTARGHQFFIASRHKDVTVDLLESYGFAHQVLSTQRKGRGRLGVELVTRTCKVVAIARRFKPDYLLGLMGPVIAIAGRFLPVRTVVFYDNETTDRINRMAVRMSDAWWSPRGFALDYGSNHFRYDGYHELAYLHPNRFTPDPKVIQSHGLDARAPYYVLRFVSWESIHDFGESGFSVQGKRELVDKLSAHGRVLISSEKELPPEFDPYRLSVPVQDIHHVLAFADLLVGESSTMASEAACLGTHSVFVSRSGRGVNDEQSARYGISHNFHGGSEEQALTCITDLLAHPDIKGDARQRQQRLLADTIDVTGFLIDYFESRMSKVP